MPVPFIVLLALVGFLAGISATLFLVLLNWVTEIREQHSYIIWGLPFAGVLISLFFSKMGKQSAMGSHLVIDEILDPKETIPLRMAPLILFGTLLTHFFGGSAGREGTAVQMGASLSDSVARFFKVSVKQRQTLLMAGAGAGFGAAVGAPLAGSIFGMEMLRVGRPDLTSWWECLFTSFTAWGVTYLLHAPHTHFLSPEPIPFNILTILAVLGAAICFGLLARWFVGLTHFLEHFLNKTFSSSELKIAIGGILLVLLYALEGSYRFTGLGIPVIEEALKNPANAIDIVYKWGFTSLTLASGYKGGEFVPLVFMGSVLGSALSEILPAPTTLLGALGFASVFGAASNTPLACSLMALELFGVSITPYAFLSCFVSFLVSGPKGIYKTQSLSHSKWSYFKKRP